MIGRIIVARLNWAKNEQQRRVQRFDSAPAAVGPPVTYEEKKKATKKKKRAKPRTAAVELAPPRRRPAISQSDLSTPDAFERFRSELAQLDQEIAELEKPLLARRARRAAVVAALKKVTPPGKAFHPEKLIPAGEAGRRKMRRRNKSLASPHLSKAANAE